MKGPQGHRTVFRERLENTGLGSKKKLAEYSTEREHLPWLPGILLIWAGWLMGRQARRWEQLFTSLRFSLTVGEEHALLLQPAGLGYVGNILFLQGS